MGAVEILIVYENLDTMRYVLRCHGAESNGPENGKKAAWQGLQAQKVCCKRQTGMQFVSIVKSIAFRLAALATYETVLK